VSSRVLIDGNAPGGMRACRRLLHGESTCCLLSFFFPPPPGEWARTHWPSPTHTHTHTHIYIYIFHTHMYI
jgi:hypothetical protein